MKTVRLIDPALQPGEGRIVPVLATIGRPTFVEKNQDLELPDDIAGTAPTWEPRTTNMTDMGTGLLAQHEVWTETGTPARTED